jgi:hypothetical protein
LTNEIGNAGNGRTGFQPVSEHGLEARATRELGVTYVVQQNSLDDLSAL